MTHEQIEYHNYVMQGMASYGGDVAQALVWCGNHFINLSDNQRNAINNLSAKERNQVIHELSMR
ncbi:hypothetical protein KQI03_12140 [Levilactobacillus brevis]|uniref:hypothetical protein n=1 Tax=Levilactobacillus brevis TaxID=1580 RepID=UPI001C0F3C38|nr:hypothetical protein [Levilactobacillus brevis]MBU5275371.1 hypothetical protein [Levilactobacillus brevis]